MVSNASRSSAVESRWTWLVPCSILLLGLLQATWPMVISDFAETVGGWQDTRLVHFSLEHAHRFLSGDPLNARFWDPPLYFPARNVAAYTDTMIGLTPFYSPWRWLGNKPDVAFQLWILTVLAFNFVAFFMVLRALGCRIISASVGAYLFAFGSSRLANVGHSQLLPGFFIAFALLALLRFFALDASSPEARRKSRVWLVVLFLMLIGQAYGAFYPLYFFVLCAGMAFVVALGLPEARKHLFKRLREEAPFLGLCSALALLSVFPLFERYLITAEMLGSRSWDAIDPLLPRWSSWFLMGKSNAWFGWLQETPFILAQGPAMRTGTHSNGLGLLTLFFVTLGLYRTRHQVGPRILLLTTLIAVAVTTVFPGGQTIWRLFFEYFPGADAVRAVGRIGMFLLIPGGWGLALFCDHLWKQRRWLIVLVVFALVAIEQTHEVKSYDRLAAREAVARVVEAVEIEREQRDCLAFLVTTFGPKKYSPIHEDAEWAALELGLPTVNGRYGNWPVGWKFAVAHRPRGSLGKQRLQEMVDALRAWSRQYGLRPERICWFEFDANFQWTAHKLHAEPTCQP